MYNLTITELAQNDLDEIVKYILNEYSNEIAAITFLQAFQVFYCT